MGGLFALRGLVGLERYVRVFGIGGFRLVEAPLCWSCAEDRDSMAGRLTCVVSGGEPVPEGEVARDRAGVVMRKGISPEELVPVMEI